MTTSYTVDVIAGDGIGTEVVPAAITCVDRAAELHGFRMDWRHRAWGSDHYRRHGSMMPHDGLEQLRDGDAIFLGAVGTPDIKDDVTLWGLLIPIRRAFHQYVNLRPVKTVPGRSGQELDLLIVRENVEGEYSEIGGRLGRGTPDEIAVQESVFTRRGIERVTRFAVARAAERGGTLISATKSNGIIHTMPFWDAVVAEVAAEGGVRVDSVLIDALAARFVLAPGSIDVVVASNLFGDILSDLAAAVAGSIGIAPSANLNPEREWPSLFEPVHGSAPDIAGRGVANPTAAIWSAAMMLDHLGETAASAALHDACFGTLADGIATGDLGGTATTAEFTEAVLDRLGRPESPHPTPAAATSPRHRP